MAVASSMMSPLPQGIVNGRGTSRGFAMAPLLGCASHVDTRVESVGGAVRAFGSPPLRRPGRGARLRQRRRERPLPPLARPRRARAVLLVLARRARREDVARADGDERGDADLPLSP